MGSFFGATLGLEEIAHDELQQAYAYWSRKREGGAFPSRRDIQPHEIVPFLSHVMLIQVSYDPLDFIYTIYGTSISIPSGKDYTSLSVRDITPPEFSAVIWEQYSEVVEARRPMLHSVGYADGPTKRSYQRLTMPLSSDGSVIDKLFAVSMEDRSFWDGIT